MTHRNRIKVALRRGFARTFVVAPVVFLLVAGAGCPSLFESTNQRATRIRQAQAGHDGSRIITPGPTGTVVNAYAALKADTNPAAKDTTITVESIATLNAGNALFTTDLARGDLVLIIQMAGATINLAANTAAYGEVTNLGSAGRYEFAGVESVVGNVITLACGLKNSYSGGGKVQVIRVPQYTTLTIQSGASITAPAWNGITGGVVAVHAETTLQLNGSVDVSSKGFRGGAAPVGKTSSAAGSNILLYRSTTETGGAQKGEGIAGYQADYTTGQYGRGAPANAGGGGDSHNAGGGGGANARSGATWTGQGVMLSTVGGAAAWALDPGYVNSTLANSEGGGRGGYSYSDAALNPLSVGPDPTNGSWLGDNRREVGGLGGHPLDNDPKSRLFMGGGGGAGDGNDGAAGPGGAGGGLIFLIAGAITGNGSIHANGATGGSSSGAANTAGDGAGGGGGGGTVFVHAGSITGLTGITADGGAGGNHTNGVDANEVEGPGGGGGGGYIAVSGGAPALSAAGALGGTTTVTTSAMSNFRSNGATAGNAGQTDGDATNFFYCGLGTSATPVTTISAHPTDSTSTTGNFAFEATEPGVTEAGVTLGAGTVSFECSIDNGPWLSCAATYTTPVLTVATHTLNVRATDLVSGNEEQGPPYVGFTWQVLANQIALDGGNYDAEGAIDSGAVDGSAAEAPSALEDAEGMDALANDDLWGADDTESPDLHNDTVVIIVRDDAASGVPSADAEKRDLLPILFDAGERLDTQVLATDGLGGDVADVLDAIVDPNPDTASPPESNPDTAGPLVKNDAALSINKDAAPAAEDLKIMGSGFCAIASPRSTSSMPFMVMALAALALLGRRRRQ